jgi:hypothetical protein
MLEAYTTLGYLAARTQRIRLGTMVTAATYRRPPCSSRPSRRSTCCRAAGHGRDRAGYTTEEARALGLRCRRCAERSTAGGHAEDRPCAWWAADAFALHGRQLVLERPVSSPRARPPGRIRPSSSAAWASGRTLPLVVRHGDACNLFDIPDGGQTLRPKLAVLEDLCAAGATAARRSRRRLQHAPRAGRSRPRRCAERCAGLAALGIDHVVLITEGRGADAELATLAAAKRRSGRSRPAAERGGVRGVARRPPRRGGRARVGLSCRRSRRRRLSMLPGGPGRPARSSSSAGSPSASSGPADRPRGSRGRSGARACRRSLRRALAGSWLGLALVLLHLAFLLGGRRRAPALGSDIDGSSPRVVAPPAYPRARAREAPPRPIWAPDRASGRALPAPASA